MKAFLVLLLSQFPLVCYAGNPITLQQANTLANNSGNRQHFTENKGQVRQTDGLESPYVTYVLERGDVSIFLLKEGGIAWQFNQKHYPEGYHKRIANRFKSIDELQQWESLQQEVRLETFRMDMFLEGADRDAEIIATGKSRDYINFYNRNVLQVHHYQKVTYRNVYPGIDWVIYTTEQGLKYEFDVQPGTDPSIIRLKFSHHEELYLDSKGNLVHGNRMGQFLEQAPVSYQQGEVVATRFVLEGDVLQFVLDGYDPSLPLTIDPDRIWGTYYGGSEYDAASSCAIDGDGNIYLAGTTESAAGIAAGGHQNMYGGGDDDAFLVKFNAAGVRQWATYYGGDDLDWGWDCAVDGNGNVYLAGETFSDNNIASGGHQNILGGLPGDAFLVKFNASGVREWATYYGGDNWDWGNACTTDGNGNVYLTGATASTGNIASGGHQNIHGGGVVDAFLVKFNTNGVRQWATYYGGNDIEWADDCATDNDGNIYLAGFTKSTNNIASGGHQNLYGGGDYDAFLVKFDNSGVRQWATYYGGNGFDDGYSCTVDNQGNVFLAGVTSSTNNIAFGGHQNTYGGDSSDAYLVKFNAAGVRQWATYFGGNKEDGATSCVTDDDGNVYLAGGAGSGSNIAWNGHQNTFGGGEIDAFLAKFDSSGIRLWATYLGGSGSDVALSCAIDSGGYVYIAGYTSSGNNIASGGHQNTHTGDYDAFLVKFRAGTGTGITQPDIDPVMAPRLTISPNPNQGRFLITVEGNRIEAVETTIFNITGQVVYHSEKEHGNGTSYSREVSISGTGGIFLVRVRVGNVSLVQKLVVTP